MHQDSKSPCDKSHSLRSSLSTVLASLSILLAIAVVPAVQAQSGPHILITQNIDESKLVTLAGNTRPEATAKYDRGRVADNFVIQHMLLQLQRSPEQERELERYIDELTDKSSPNFHQWLTAKEYGERFGLAKQDRDAIKSWLESHNLKVNVDYTNGILIDFSGTAGAIRGAFHTEIHKLNVKGEKHFANMSDPRIPAALAPAVAGVVALHDFKPHAMHEMKTKANYTTSEGYYAVVPGDLEKIYNFDPVFSAGISGQGQTIVVLEDTDLYTTADWTKFRSTFGLSSYTDGSLTTTHPAPPSGTNNCTDPGTNGDDGEAILDAEYASAAAPSAKIELASCEDTATFGGLIALQNIINGSGPYPETISMSYGECEAFNGAASNAAFNSAFQQTVSEGVSMFVSSGDDASAGCDRGATAATHGIGITGWGSSQYTVSVGGTDFGDSYAGTNSTYWSSSNSSTYESALSYINEIPWNVSCGSVLIATYLGFSSTYGSSGLCNSTTASDDGLLNTIGGSGGPSECATGSPSVSGVVSGTCAGWPKPSYQSVFGNPSDGVRDTPDVSLFAANAPWGHYYVFCWSDPSYTADGSAPCTGAPDNWSGGGGTSFSSPIWAGIQALIDQKAGGPQGPVNPVYYKLADTEYGSSGDSSCNSTLGNAAGSSCVFYDVTQGDNDVDCQGSYDCYLPSGTYGVLSTSDSAYDIAYGTRTGWDFPTGIGTPNVYNLVEAWPTTSGSFTLSANPTTVSIGKGEPGQSTTVTVTPSGGFSGSVTLSTSTLPKGVTGSFSTNPATSTSTLTLTASSSAAVGTHTITITGTSGSLKETTTFTLKVGAPNYTVTANPTTVTVKQGSSGTSTITVVPTYSFSSPVTLTATGEPSGVTVGFSPNPTSTTSTLTFTVSASAKVATSTVTVTGKSGSLSHTVKVKIKVTS